MAILKLKPAYKDYIWGGTRLISDYNKVDGGTRLAESWELSCHADGAKEILRAIYAYAQIANGNAADYEEAKLIPIAAPETEEVPLLYESSFADGSVGDMKWRCWRGMV